MVDVRSALEALCRERGEDYASLSRLIGRNAAYIQQFIKRGTPQRLAEEDREEKERLAALECLHPKARHFEDELQ